MRRSETIAELAAALAKAQGEIRGAEKDRENPHFRSQYATLDSVWKACRAALSANGLSVAQGIDGDALVTLLAHSSGQWYESRLPVALPADPQKAGSAITYLRRYSLAAMVGVAPTDDDDAEGACGRPAEPQRWRPEPAQERRPEPQRPALGDTARALIARIGELAPAPALANWATKHRAEIEALPEADRVAVRDAYRVRSAALGPYRPAGAPPHPADGGE